MSENKIPQSKVNTLMACRIIATRFLTDIDILSLVRTNWTAEYANGLLSRVDDAFDNHLGRDSTKLQRLKTMELSNLIEPVKRDLAFLKVQINVDFEDKSERNEILKELGFTNNLLSIRNGDQEALITLLKSFTTNLTPVLTQKIVEKGTSEALLTNLSNAAAEIIQANTSQELLKESSRESSHESLAQISELYNEIIGICKIASKYFQSNEVKKAEYTFKRVVGNLNFKRVKEKENNEKSEK